MRYYVDNTVPEFIESTFFLYQATKDPFYLDVGAQIFEDLQRAKVPCGLATIADVLATRLEDRMESFVLSETLKYLYLLFDEDNPLAGSDSNIVFSTEGHILTLNAEQLRPMSKSRRLAKKVGGTMSPNAFALTLLSTVRESYMPRSSHRPSENTSATTESWHSRSTGL